MEWTTKTNTFNYMVTQPDPDIPVASQKRIVRAHKDTIEQVQWSSVELQEIQAADVWRQRQGIDKRLLHNCTAEAQGKHFILPLMLTFVPSVEIVTKKPPKIVESLVS